MTYMTEQRATETVKLLEQISQMNGRHDSGMACKSFFSHVAQDIQRVQTIVRRWHCRVVRRSVRDFPQEVRNCSERLRDRQLGTYSSLRTSGYFLYCFV